MGIFEWIFGEKSYMPLNSEKCIQNLKKYQKIICCFLLIRMERNAHITSNRVYCSVKMLVLFQISYIEGPGSATIK